MAATSSLDSTRTSDPPPSRQLTRVVATSSPPPTRIRSGESNTARSNGTTPHSCSPVHSWHPLSHTDPDAAGRAVTRSSGPASTSALSMAPGTRFWHGVASGVRLHWTRTSGESTGSVSGPITSTVASSSPVRSTRRPAHQEDSSHTQLVQWPGRCLKTDNLATSPAAIPSESRR